MKKVFLENFSVEDTSKIKREVPNAKFVKTLEESDFWFTPNTSVEEVISTLVNGVEIEELQDPSPEDLRQRKA